MNLCDKIVKDEVMIMNANEISIHLLLSYFSISNNFSIIGK